MAEVAGSTVLSSEAFRRALPRLQLLTMGANAFKHHILDLVVFKLDMQILLDALYSVALCAEKMGMRGLVELIISLLVVGLEAPDHAMRFKRDDISVKRCFVHRDAFFDILVAYWTVRLSEQREYLLSGSGDLECCILFHLLSQN